jgi:DNA-binding NarL/FixJ family response regulator
MVVNAAGSHSTGMPSRTATAAPVKVFLADDSAPIRDRVAAMLCAQGMTVVGEAATPADCIHAILATHPDVVVLDVQLEGGTGLQVLQAVRAAAPDIAFVVLSNTSGPVYRKRYLGAGATAFLDKNAEFDQLAGAARRAALVSLTLNH